MSGGETTRRAGRLAYREATPAEPSDRPPVLLLHGFPESSYMWRRLLEPIAAAGHRAVAPDLLGYGDSPPDPPATWERHIEALAEFVAELELGPAVLVVHDWGGLVGLRWAAEDPDRVAGLVISDTGFFPDGEWHGMAKALRSEGEGEQILAAIDRKTFARTIEASGRGFGADDVEEYYKAFSSPEGRTGVLEMYRSGDFEKFAPYQGRLGALGVPTLILWGEDDVFAPVAGAYRFRKEVPAAEVEVVENAGHFVWSDEPERCRKLLTSFLARHW